MDEQEILELKARVQEGGIWWHDPITGVCKPVARIDLNWVEFPDEPDLSEPAARLQDGGAVALCNVTSDSFVVLTPCLAKDNLTFLQEAKRAGLDVNFMSGVIGLPKEALDRLLAKKTQ